MTKEYNLRDNKNIEKNILNIVSRLISRLWGIMMSVQQTSARVFRIYTCWFLTILGSREIYIYIVFTSSSKLVRKLVSLFLFVFDIVDFRQASPVSCHEATQVSQSMPKSNAFAKHVHCHKVKNIRSSYDSDLHKQDNVPMKCWHVQSFHYCFVTKTCWNLIASWRHQHGLARMLSICSHRQKQHCSI